MSDENTDPRYALTRRDALRAAGALAATAAASGLATTRAGAASGDGSGRR